MDRFDKMALMAVIFVTLLYMPMVMPGSLADTYYTTQMSAGGRPIWYAGLILASYGSIAIAAWFYRWSDTASAAWILHLLFLPAILAPWAIGSMLMESVIEDSDFDATMGTPVMPGTLLFLIALVGYCAMVIGRSISQSKAVADASK